jgi:hypothetical protein
MADDKNLFSLFLSFLLNAHLHGKQRASEREWNESNGIYFRKFVQNFFLLFHSSLYLGFDFFPLPASSPLCV